MAWLALLAGLLFPLLALCDSSGQVAAIAPHFYLFVAAVVGTYVGFATLDDKWQKGQGGV